MKKANNFVLVIIAISLFRFSSVQNSEDKKMNNFRYFSTLRIITSYNNGLVLAVDGKGSPLGLDTDKIDEIFANDEKRKLIYHRKLFKVGKNLVVAFGGQLIRDYGSIQLPEDLIKYFFKEYSINEDNIFQIDDIAKKLLNFLNNRYYSQPKEYWKNEASVFLAGLNENEPKVCIILVNSSNNKFGDLKNGIIYYEKFFNVLKHGPHWQEIEAKSKDISKRFHLIKTKIDNYEAISRKEAISREEAIYFTLIMMKECIKIEASIQKEIEMSIDYPIHYCFIEKNKPIEIKKITH